MLLFLNIIIVLGTILAIGHAIEIAILIYRNISNRRAAPTTASTWPPSSLSPEEFERRREEMRERMKRARAAGWNMHEVEPGIWMGSLMTNEWREKQEGS